MPIKKPNPIKGMAICEALYGGQPTKDNIPITPLKTNPLDRPPAIIPGVQYPISDRERTIILATWLHCRKIGGGL